MSDLIWDKGNRGHAKKHRVSDEEIEQVFRRVYHVEAQEIAENDEQEFHAYGTTAKGRYLTVPFNIRQNRIRPITAWPMTPKELTDYAKEIY